MRPENRAARTFPRHRDDAEYRHAAKTQAHGDGEGGQTGGEIGSAVEGVEEPQVIGFGIDGVFGLLADDAVVGEGAAQSVPQQRLGTAVGLGHGRLLAFLLEFNLQGLPEIRQQHGAGLPNGLHAHRLSVDQHLPVGLHFSARPQPPFAADCGCSHRQW